MNRDITVTIDNQNYMGSYSIEKGVLHVLSAYGSKATQPGPAPESIARTILRELVRDHLALERLEKNRIHSNPDKT